MAPHQRDRAPSAPRSAGTRPGATLLRLATAGSVDDGKSTLVGRLLFDTNSVLTDTLDSIETASRRKGLDRADLALLTDGLRAEREQGITIDVAYRYFATTARKFMLADCPGHVQYTRNTVTGSSTARRDRAAGRRPQGRDRADPAPPRRRRPAAGAARRAGRSTRSTSSTSPRRCSPRSPPTSRCCAAPSGCATATRIPVSALEGDNVVTRSPADALVRRADRARLPRERRRHLARGRRGLPLPGAERRPAAVRGPGALGGQRPQVDGDYRGYAGKVEAGRISVGDEVVVLPRRLARRGSRRSTPRTGRSSSRSPASRSCCGSTATWTSPAARSSPRPTRRRPRPATSAGTVCWLTDRTLSVGDRVLVQHGTSLTKAIVKQIDGVLDLDFDARSAPTLAGQRRPGAQRHRARPARAGRAPPGGPLQGAPRHRLVHPRRRGDGWTLAAGMAGPTQPAHPGRRPARPRSRTGDLMTAPTLVLLGPGSHDPRTPEISRQISRGPARSCGPTLDVHAAYLDHCGPTAHEVVAKLAAPGSRRSCCVPLLLSDAFGAQEEVPVLVAELNAAHDGRARRRLAADRPGGPAALGRRPAAARRAARQRTSPSSTAWCSRRRAASTSAATRSSPAAPGSGRPTTGCRA